MKRLIIESTGRAFIRTWKDTEVSLTDAVIGTMSNGVSVSIRSAMQLQSHEETMRVSGRFASDDTSVWVVNLRSIRFTAGITSRDGLVSLNFESPNKMEVLWKPPADMAMSLLVTVYRGDGGSWWCDKCYLVAYDRDGVAYRMPVANVFDDTSLCTGEYSRTGATIQDLIRVSYVQFRESPWNADLYSSKSDEFKIRTTKLFRWRANNEGFEQIAPEQAWQTLCERVGNDTVDKVAQLALDTARDANRMFAPDEWAIEDDDPDVVDEDGDGGDR